MHRMSGYGAHRCGLHCIAQGGSLHQLEPRPRSWSPQDPTPVTPTVIRQPKLVFDAICVLSVAKVAT